MPIFSKLPLELSDAVFTELSVFDLVHVAATCKAGRVFVCCEVHVRYVRMVQPLVDSVSDLNMLFLCMHTVFSGSFALHYGLTPPNWVPGNRNVYTGFKSYQEVVAFFLRQQYHILWHGLPVGVVRDDYCHLSGIMDVTKLGRVDGQKVDIICSKMDTTKMPVALFWGTVVMNILTPTQFICAYPRVLVQKVSEPSRIWMHTNTLL